eukprot:1756506-Amphidinium_carterae.1
MDCGRAAVLRLHSACISMRSIGFAQGQSGRDVDVSSGGRTHAFAASFAFKYSQGEMWDSLILTFAFCAEARDLERDMLHTVSDLGFAANVMSDCVRNFLRDRSRVSKFLAFFDANVDIVAQKERLVRVPQWAGARTSCAHALDGSHFCMVWCRFRPSLVVVEEDSLAL